MGAPLLATSDSNSPSASGPRHKVLFCSDGVFPTSVGGIQRHSRLLVEALGRRGACDLTVVLPDEGEPLFADVPNVREIRVPARPGRRQYILEVRDLSRRIREVVEAHPEHIVYSQGLAVWSGIRSFGHRVIVNPHGLEGYQALRPKDWLIGFPFRCIFDHLFKHSGHVISLGGSLTKILSSRIPKQRHKIRVIPNAVGERGLATVANDHRFRGPLRVLFVGRFAYNKGIDLLLKAAGELHATPGFEELELDLVGGGPLLDFLRSRYGRPGVRFHGFAEESVLWRLYGDCDVFVLPTLFEGMPTVVLEAMSYGMPAITTDVGATAELVTPDTGLIIEKGSVEAVATGIKIFGELTRERKLELSRNSQELVASKFTWERVAEAHEALFKELGAVPP